MLAGSPDVPGGPPTPTQPPGMQPHLQRQHILPAVIADLEDAGLHLFVRPQLVGLLAAEGRQDGALGRALRDGAGGAAGTRVCQAKAEAPQAQVVAASAFRAHAPAGKPALGTHTDNTVHSARLLPATEQRSP